MLRNKIFAIFIITTLASTLVVAQERNSIGQEEKIKIQPTVMPVFKGDGFAIRGDEFHVVMIHVIQTKSIHPSLFRRIPRGKNADEIRNIVRTSNSLAFKGRIRFAREYYVLNISDADREHMNAKISKNGEDIGDLSIKIKEYEGLMIGDGKIAINDDSYKLLLHVGQLGLKEVKPIVERRSITNVTPQKAIIEPKPGRRWWQFWKYVR